jgi:hypothetical protein
MTAQNIVGIVAIVCGCVCGLLATLGTFQMVDNVNEKLPETERFAPLWWDLSKTLRLWRNYKKFYPDGHLLMRVRILMAFMFACVFIAGWGFGIFAK